MKKSRMFLFLLALLATVACHPVPAAAHDMRKTQQKFQDLVNRIDEELAREAAGLPPIGPDRPIPTPVPLQPTPTAAPTPTPHPLEVFVDTEGQDYIPLDDFTTAEERADIKSKTLAFIDEFVDQSATETPEDREVRLKDFLTPDSVVDKVMLYPVNTFSSMYGVIKETTGSDPFDFAWSHAQNRFVITLVSITITYTDNDGFTDSNTQLFMLNFHKEENDEWLIYNLDNYLTLPVTD